jgi:hypothetical protein
MQPEVSGRAFLGPIKHLRSHYGQDAITRLQMTASPALKSLLATRIRGTQWFAYALFAEFLECAQRELAPGDAHFHRDLGDAAGRLDITGIFKVYAAISSPERLIRACAKIWPSYYRNTGEMEALTWAPENTSVCISDFKEMSPHHCLLMEGWMLRVLQEIGIQVDPGGRETECMNTGGTHHLFSCTWKKKR